MIRLVLILFLTLCLVACNDAEKFPAIPAGATVLILGDSLSYGTGAGENQDYPTLLANNTGWNIINAGVPGDTSEQGLARLSALLEEYQPNLLIIELGGNDFLHKVAVDKTKANINIMIQTAKSKNIATLIIAIPDYQPIKAALGGLSDHAIYAELAEETQTPLIENIFSDVLSDNALKADHVHPNTQGYQVVEAQLRASLAELGLLAD